MKDEIHKSQHHRQNEILNSQKPARSSKPMYKDKQLSPTEKI